jgi:hypothetical protein
VATVVSNLVLSHERRKKGRVATTTNWQYISVVISAMISA